MLFTFSASISLAQTAYRVIEVKHGGTITGIVKFAGPVPAYPPFIVTKNVEECGRTKPFDRLILDKSNGLKNAVVYIEDVTAGKPFPTTTMYTINQHKCEYVPHVQVVPTGDQLQIVNSDNILHNVHAYDQDNGLHTVCNIAQPVRGQHTPIKQSELRGVDILLTTCDAGHPWMSGYVIFSKNPYYAVTDSHGKFVLMDVPPGTYKIRMWHEGFKIVGTETENGKVKRYNFESPYEVVKDVTVSEGGKTLVSFELASR
jgi:plastocyanin